MKKVCVITGGGSGIGLAAAHIMGKDYRVVLCGRTGKKLEKALKELRDEGVEAESFVCDVSDREAVHKLAVHAGKLGEVTAVIHAAGMSPHMGDARKIMEANALGTIFINEEFYEVMGPGSCIVDVASMAGYLLPGIVIPRRSYPLCFKDKAAFMKKMMARVHMLPARYHSDIAYGISKNFVIWYAAAGAMRFGEKGIRLLSVSPGNFETPMGELEKEEASSYLRYCAVKRFGDPGEIAELLAFAAGKKPGYLTGVDILMDGGCVAGRRMRRITVGRTAGRTQGTEPAGG